MSKDARKLRVIDQNTNYDVPAMLKQMARSIQNGELGDVRTAVLILRERTPNGESYTTSKYFGKGNFEEAIFMMEVAEARWLK